MIKRTGKILFIGLCAFGGGIASGAFLQFPLLSAEVGNPDRRTGAAAHLSERFEEVIRQTAPTVVSIEAVKPPKDVQPGKSAKPIEESGSGVLVKMEGVKGTVVITNNHVVGGARPDQITVHLADDRVFRPVQVWTDPESDIAAMRLDDDKLPTTILADSDRARVGQWVLAFGSPFGLNQTVTHGIISAKERGQVSLGATIRIKEFLQTDAAINPGSSGGPLVNLDSEVIGINTAIASNNGSNSGVSFSIPSNLVKNVVKQLVEKGTVTRGYLGVHLSSGMEPADALKLGLTKVQGALVESVYPESPASKAGLKQYDVILQVDGLPVRNENQLINLISGLQSGQKVKLLIWRDRKEWNTEATVGDWAATQVKSKG